MVLVFPGRLYLAVLQRLVEHLLRIERESRLFRWIYPGSIVRVWRNVAWLLDVTVDSLNVEVRVLADGSGLLSELQFTILVELYVALVLVGPSHEGWLPQLSDVQVALSDAFLHGFSRLPCHLGRSETRKCLLFLVLRHNLAWNNLGHL